MRNTLVYESTTRQRWINGKLYEFTRWSEPRQDDRPAFMEINVRRWNGHKWELVHIFSR